MKIMRRDNCSEQESLCRAFRAVRLDDSLLRSLKNGKLAERIGATCQLSIHFKPSTANILNASNLSDLAVLQDGFVTRLLSHSIFYQPLQVSTEEVFQHVEKPLAIEKRNVKFILAPLQSPASGDVSQMKNQVGGR